MAREPDRMRIWNNSGKQQVPRRQGSPIRVNILEAIARQ